MFISACNNLANELSEVVNSGRLEPGDRVKYLNAVKMTCYLLCSFMEQFEAEQIQPGAFEINMGKVNESIRNISSHCVLSDRSFMVHPLGYYDLHYKRHP